MPATAQDLTFNPTDTRGLAACVVSRGLEVRIDAERIKDTVSMDFLARCFSLAENRALKEIEGEDRNIPFYNPS